MRQLNTATLAIREATEDDLGAILQLYAQPLLENGGQLSEAKARPVFARIRSYPNYRVFVAALGAQIVGTFSLLIVDNLTHHGTPSGLIEAVAVDPLHQRQGIGRTMLSYAMQQCRLAGCYKLALSANRKRPHAHAFYEALGFERHGYSFLLPLRE